MNAVAKLPTLRERISEAWRTVVGVTSAKRRAATEAEQMTCRHHLANNGRGLVECRHCGFAMPDLSEET